MIFTNTKTQGITKKFKDLEQLMKSMDFVRWTWDYEKVVYDKKYVLGENTYYLRLQGNVINDKSLENPETLLELQQPVFAEHFFPHGLDESADIPEALTAEINHTIEKLEDTLMQVK